MANLQLFIFQGEYLLLENTWPNISLGTRDSNLVTSSTRRRNILVKYSRVIVYEFAILAYRIRI